MLKIDERYAIEDIESIPSPAYIFFDEIIDLNIDEMIRIAGDVKRLRPHCKTHKTPQIAEKLISKGIDKHKCATIAEAEMLANAGAVDVFLAYNIVGPNIARIGKFLKKFPNVHLSVTADHPSPLSQLSAEMEKLGTTVGVVMDLDTGLERTGIAPNEQAVELYEMICSSPGIQPAGLHWYDGQHRQTELFERTAAVESGIAVLLKLRDRLLMNGFPVPRIIVGGTGSFPVHALHQEPNLELSPGTVILHDAGYSRMYPDLKFTPAAAVLTRVISRPSETRVTFDLGSKAIAADPPAGSRCHFPQIPEAKEVLQNEEHLVLETNEASSLQPGDYQLVFPTHVCPTSAMYQSAIVIRDGRQQDRWDIVARDRKLTI
jgi:D-serine deaminase-like pyridoxal phosphate-dependent protein